MNYKLITIAFQQIPRYSIVAWLVTMVASLALSVTEASYSISMIDKLNTKQLSQENMIKGFINMQALLIVEIAVELLEMAINCKVYDLIIKNIHLYADRLFISSTYNSMMKVKSEFQGKVGNLINFVAATSFIIPNILRSVIKLSGLFIIFSSTDVFLILYSIMSMAMIIFIAIRFVNPAISRTFKEKVKQRDELSKEKNTLSSSLVEKTIHGLGETVAIKMSNLTHRMEQNNSNSSIKVQLMQRALNIINCLSVIVFIYFNASVFTYASYRIMMEMTNFIGNMIQLWTNITKQYKFVHEFEEFIKKMKRSKRDDTPRIKANHVVLSELQCNVKEFTLKLGDKPIVISRDEPEMYIIEGENGAGKSTFIRALCGLVEDEDDISIKFKLTADGRRTNFFALEDERMVLMQRSDEDYRNQSILGYLGYAHATANDIKWIYEMMITVGLGSEKERFADLNTIIGGLSGGQEQRLRILRLFSQLRRKDPLFAVLDEPGTALDEGEHDIQYILNAMREQFPNVTYFIIHHGDIEIGKATTLSFRRGIDGTSTITVI